MSDTETTPIETLTETTEPAPVVTKKPRGFAAMSPERVRELAGLGGKAAHKNGKAHKFTLEEARAAGKKGGNAPHKSRGRSRLQRTEATTDTSVDKPVLNS